MKIMDPPGTTGLSVAFLLDTFRLFVLLGKVIVGSTVPRFSMLTKKTQLCFGGSGSVKVACQPYPFAPIFRP